MSSQPEHLPPVIIGAGPAGLTAAFELARRGRPPLVLEASPWIGGIARTHLWEGNRLDIGGHRFFTKSPEVQKLWAEMLDEPMLQVPRLSRIYFNGKLFQYPLQIGNTIQNLGLWESTLMLASYARARLAPELPEHTFEQWVRNRFGDRLYRTFFKTYTEKVWGISCREIRADWAAQRIQGLNFCSAVLNALCNRGRVKSLIKTFDYPRLGPGMLWESCARKIRKLGGVVLLESPVVRLLHESGRVHSIEVKEKNGRRVLQVDSVISTMALPGLVKSLDPSPPAHILAAAAGLKHRDFLIVALACRSRDIFPDNWIYVHSPHVRVGRIQNFRNWSADLVAPGNGTTLGMEYFCSRGDALWETEDADLIEIAKQEICKLGLVDGGDLGPGCVIRETNAYPVYDAAYRTHVDTLRHYLAGEFSNLQTAGRNGLHRYNNQDHSMLAGQLAALRQMEASDRDVWDVNVDRSYHEEFVTAKSTGRNGTDILVAENLPPPWRASK